MIYLIDMADIDVYATRLIEAILFTIYFNLSGKEKVHILPKSNAMPVLLSQVGLHVLEDDGRLFICDSDGTVISSITVARYGETISICVEPAMLVFKALALLRQPIQISY